MIINEVKYTVGSLHEAHWISNKKYNFNDNNIMDLKAMFLSIRLVQ